MDESVIQFGVMRNISKIKMSMNEKMYETPFRFFFPRNICESGQITWLICYSYKPIDS